MYQMKCLHENTESSLLKNVCQNTFNDENASYLHTKTI